MSSRSGKTIAIILMLMGLMWGVAYGTPPTPADINAAILDGLDYLVTTQNPNGSWGTNNIEPRPEFPPAPDDGDVAITALCVWSLLSHGVGEGDPPPYGPVLDAGIDYLLTHVQADGSISNGRFPDYQTSAAVIALHATSNPAYAPDIIDARAFLKSAQIAEPNFPTIPPPILQAMPTYGGWGYNRQSSSGWPIDPVSGTDVMIAGNSDDVGDVPLTGPFWMSPNIWVDNDEDGTPDDLVPDAPNKIWVRVFNRGDAPATNVHADLFLQSPPDLGSALPFPIGIGVVPLPDIAPLGAEVGYVEWNAPVGFDHHCIGAVAYADEDPPDLSVPVWMDNNQALKNVISAAMPNGHAFVIPFTISNPTEAPLTVQVDVEAHLLGEGMAETPVVPVNWDIQVIGGPTSGVPLAPGASQVRTLTITPTGALEWEKIQVVVTEKIEDALGVGGQVLGGLTVFAKIGAAFHYVPWYPRPFLWADLSNSQWVIMALSFTEPDFVSTLWDDRAIVFVDRCQEPPPGTGQGRGFFYTPPEDDVEGAVPMPAYGSMSHAGIWSNALMPFVRTPINYLAALNWARHNYSVSHNPGWGQTVYYYYAVTMAKALQLSHMPWIVEPGPVIHNWYIELAEELLNRQNGNGSWVNSDTGFGEWNTDLCTAYALLALKSKASPPPCLKLLIRLLADGVDLRIRDFRGRILSELIQEIPTGTFTTLPGEQTALLDSLESATYRIVLENPGAALRTFSLLIRTFCEDDTLFARALDGEIGPGGILGANLNVSNIFGAGTILVDEFAAIPTIAATPETLRLDLITGVTAAIPCTLSAIGDTTAHLVTLSGHLLDGPGGVAAAEAEAIQPFQFDPNGFDLEPGSPQEIDVQVTLPETVPVGMHRAEMLVSSYNAETIGIPMALNVMLGIRLPTVYTGPGQQIEVPVEIDDATGLGILSTQARILYDGDLLEATGVSVAGTLTDGWTVEDTVTVGVPGAPDTLKFAMATAVDTLTGAGFLAIIEFAVAPGASPGDASDLTFLRFLLNEGDPTARAQNGSVNVGRPGDVSGNGAVTAYDAAGVLQFSVGVPDVLARFPYVDRLPIADVTLNGAITAFDATRILQFVIGSIPSLPYLEVLARSAPESPRALAFGDAYARAGSQATVPLIIDEIANVLSGEIEIIYDPAKIGAAHATRGDLLSDYLFESRTSNGRMRICFAAPQSATGHGEMAQLTVEVLPDVDEEVALGSLTLLDVQLNDGAIPADLRTEAVSETPHHFGLHQCFPNPFNPETAIRYDIPLESEVTLKIYNLAGQLVRVLVDERQAPGRHTIQWDGRDARGHEVASGAYFYRMTVPDLFKQTQRMMLVR